MSDDSPWPERRRTQRLLFAAGTILLVPAALSFAGRADPGGTVVVGCATVASALLIYGLLGWAGDRVANDEPGEDAAELDDAESDTSGPDAIAGRDATAGHDAAVGRNGANPAGDEPVD